MNLAEMPNRDMPVVVDQVEQRVGVGWNGEPS